MHTYAIKSLPKAETEIEVTLPFLEFEPQVKKAAVLISEKVEIAGFRKGKAPYDVVKNKVGEMAIYEEAAELAVRKTYPKILEEIFQKNKADGKDFTPIGKPDITIIKLAPGNDLQYKVRFALLPEVILPNYKALATKIKKAKPRGDSPTDESTVGEILVSEAEIEKTLQWLRESRAPSVTVDRPAQKGDLLEINFEIRMHGVKIENGDSRNHPLILGKGNFLPGFEDHLMGAKAGEEKAFSLTAPQNWHDKNLAGKNMDFKVSIKLVRERQLPEINDDFAKNVGNFESLETLKANIRNGLKQEKKEKEAQRIKASLIEEIAKETVVEVPEFLIERESDKMLAELKSGIENIGMKWEDYLPQIKKNPDELKKDWRNEAKKRVRIALTLREIAIQENIEVPEREVKERASKILKRYKTNGQAEKGIDLNGLTEYVGGVLRNEKVFEFLEGV